MDPLTCLFPDPRISTASSNSHYDVPTVARPKNGTVIFTCLENKYNNVSCVSRVILNYFG